MRSIARYALAATLATGCGGIGGSTDVDANLVFADRTDQEIMRLINAAAATEMFQAQATAMGFDDFEPGPCPAQTIDGQIVTLTGGCTDENEVMISGSVEITNPLDWGDGLIEYDYGDSQHYLFDQLALVQTGYAITFDGRLDIDANFTGYDCDLTVDQSGVAVRSDLHIECSLSGCDIGNSGIELVGVGGAHVSGRVDRSTSSSSFTLRGQDTLVVTQEPGCLHWAIEGTDRGNAACP